MYILPTARKNIARYAGRYLLFGALLLVVLSVGTASLAAGSALTAYLDGMTDKYGATVAVNDIHDGLGNPQGIISAVGLSAVRGLSPVRETCVLGSSFALWSESLTVDGRAIDTAALAADLASAQRLTEAGLAMLIHGEPEPKLYLGGEDFSTQIWTTAPPLVEGRLPQTTGEALLAADFAGLMGLGEVGPGASVTLDLGRVTQTFTVVGRYNPDAWRAPVGLGSRYVPVLVSREDAAAFDAGDNLTAYTDAMCLKYTGRQTDTASYHRYAAYFLLTDADRMGDLRSLLLEVSARVDRVLEPALYYPGGANLTDAYAASGRIVTFFLVAVIGLAAAVIAVMTVLGMHERRYEIGVLLSVGMKKTTIAILFATENLIFLLGLAVFAYAIGLAAAPLAATALIGTLTVSRLAVALPVAGQLLALAVGLSLPASAVSSLAILRYRPMTILRSRT